MRLYKCLHVSQMGPALRCAHGQDRQAATIHQYVPWHDLSCYVANSHSAPGLFRVGVVLKHSRQMSLSSRGLLPLIPINGVIFVPMDLNRPLSSQGRFDALLHKVCPANTFDLPPVLPATSRCHAWLHFWQVTGGSGAHTNVCTGWALHGLPIAFGDGV